MLSTLIFPSLFFNHIEQRDDDNDAATRIQPCATMLEQHNPVAGALKSWPQDLSFAK